MTFFRRLPDSAMACGADAVLSSVHKIMGSITQSAIVHVSDSGRIDEAVRRPGGDVDRDDEPERAADRIARRDPPARRPPRDEELLAETVDSLAELRARIREIPGLDVLDERLDRGAQRARATTRCGSSSTSAAPAPPATESRG